MSKRMFTKEEIKSLLSNANVENCSKWSITYTTAFKVKAIELYKQGFTSREIFKQAGLDLGLIGKDKPKQCLGRWRRIVKKKGVGGLKESRGENGKGGRPKTKGLSDADKIERLEIEVAYLKAENDFLAKLRATRME